MPEEGTPEGGQDPSESGQGSEPTSPPADDGGLADAGKRALAAERRARTEAERKLKQFEDANKTESQRLIEDRDQHRSRADTAELTAMRLEVALDAAPEGMSPQRIRTIAKRLIGATREELEADAAEVFAEFGSEGGGAAPRPGSRPTENLRGGGAPAEEPVEMDPRKLAEQIPRY